MKRMVRVAYVCLLPLTLAAAGCDNIALIKRDDPFARDERRGRDLDPNRDVGRDRDSDRARDELVGTVERVDQDRQEIQLRTTDGQVTRVRYDLSTRVSNRDRDMRVDDLRYGDLVRIDLGRDRGERYAEVIRLNDRSDLGSSRR
jgi:hypothetical protein